MKELTRKSFILQLIEKMRDAGSWTGETHIQKTVYFLQSLFNISLQYNYIFYKHGPFSFDLRDELTELRAEKFLKLKSKQPYGASFFPGDYVETLKEKYGRKVQNYDREIKFVADNISNKNVSELEKLSTALYVYKEKNIHKSEDMVEKIVKLKPHISEEEAKEAVKEFKDYLDDKETWVYKN